MLQCLWMLQTFGPTGENGQCALELAEGVESEVGSDRAGVKNASECCKIQSRKWLMFDSEEDDKSSERAIWRRVPWTSTVPSCSRTTVSATEKCAPSGSLLPFPASPTPSRNDIAISSCDAPQCCPPFQNVDGMCQSDQENQHDELWLSI